MADRPPLRFVRVLKEHLAACGAAELARRINLAYSNDKDSGIDRRKLKALVEGDQVPLSVDELAALDAYLTPLGEGLADKPLFEKTDPVRSLAEKGSVTLVLGSYPRAKERRNDLSRWDVRAMTSVLQGIEQRKPGTIIDVQDVLFEKELPSQLPYLLGPGASICCIGSPRACYATEFMLAGMFGVTPFAPEAASSVPLRFVWTPHVPRPYPSSFQVGADNLHDINRPLANRILDGRLWGALRVRNAVYPEWHREGDTRWTSHGVVLVQAKADGTVWVVLAGLSGPDTFACADAFAKAMTGAVPEAGRGHAPIRWDIVESTVELTPSGQGDTRAVIAQRVVDSGVFEAAKG